MPIDLDPPDPFADLGFEPLSMTYRSITDVNGQAFQQDYIGPWDNAETFKRLMLGQSFADTGWTRQIPYQLPGTNAFALEGVISTKGGIVVDPTSDAVAKDDVAVVTITYRVPVWPFQRGDNQDNNSFGTNDAERNALLWAEQEIDGDVEVITLPGTNAYWFQSGKAIATPCALFVYIQVMHIFYHKYPFLPANLTRAYLGTLNNADFLGCPRGTVMFCKPRTRHMVDSDGQFTQQAGFTFRFRKYDWNKEIVSAKKLDGDGFGYTAQWDYVVFDATPLNDPNVDDEGPWRYQYANFQNLLEFQLP